MGKRSRLRNESRGKGRFLVMSILAGFMLLVGGYHLLLPLMAGKFAFFAERSTKSGGLLDARGTIFDRNYKEMAVTLDRVSVYADVREVDAEEAAKKLAPILNVEPKFIQTVIEKDHYRAWLAKNISQEEEEQINRLKIQGVSLHREKARYYPENDVAAHVVGYVGKSMGLSGVEYRYNSLINNYGSAFLSSDAQAIEEENERRHKGQYLVLSLDLKIQRILEKFVKELGDGNEVQRTAAVLMDTTSGGIVGAATYPSYDPNKFQDYSWEILENLLTETVMVPDDIQKLFWDASLLQSRFEKDELLPWSVHAQQRSLGSQLRLWDRLGLNDPLNIDFIKLEKPAAKPGLMKHNIKPKSAYDSVVENATPLHIAQAVAGLVMGESHALPHVIDRITLKNGKTYSLKPSVKEPAVSDAVAAEIRKMLKPQMINGPLSAGYFETDSISYTVKNNMRRYSCNKLLFSVIPQDKPKLMLFVFANLPPYSPSPSKTKSRFILAGPAKKITLPMVAMQEVMSNLSDMMSVEEKNEMNFELHREIGQNVVVGDLAKAAPLRKMPDLKGLSLRKSLRLLKDLKLEIQISGTGVVVAQTPHVGRRVKYGELCRLVLKPH